MKHYVSINKTSGNQATDTVKMELTQALREAMLKAPEDKHDCWLMTHGYSDTSNEYRRKEENFNKLDTILLDFDNELKTVGEDGKLHEEVLDPNLMENFVNEFKQYDFIIWESASSTKDWPRFRALFILDKPIEFLIGEDGVKYTKRAIVSIFAKYKPDKVASWFFTPTKSKLNTVRRNRGIAFPSDRVSWLATSLMKSAMMRSELFESSRDDTQTEKNPEGWRNLPSVKKCLGGLCQGERDNSLNAACYAMNKNGYRGSIPEFLN